MPKTNRNVIAAAAIAAAVTGGAVAGAVLATPTPSGAQEVTDETTTTTVVAETDGRPGPHGHLFLDLAVAAEAIGISEDELRTALEGGASIATVAEDNGVAASTVIAALVAEATADLEARVTAAVERDGLPTPGWHGHGFHAFDLTVAAEAIGISEDELRTALEGGASIASVAEENGVDPATVVDALVAAASAEIDEKVASGDLDADRAAELKANLESRVTDLVEGEGLPRGPGHVDGPDPDA